MDLIWDNLLLVYVLALFVWGTALVVGAICLGVPSRQRLGRPIIRRVGAIALGLVGLYLISGAVTLFLWPL